MVLKLSCVAADLAAQRCFVFNPCVVRALAVLDPGRLVGADELDVLEKGLRTFYVWMCESRDCGFSRSDANRSRDRSDEGSG